MNDSEELKHARDRIQADARTISELREMLEATNKPAPKKPIQRKPERYIASREGAELLVKAIKIKGEFLDYRSRLQAMHRRAQRAEGELVKLKRKHAPKMILLKSTRPEDSDFGWKDGGPHYVPGQVEAIRINVDEVQDHFETFDDIPQPADAPEKLERK